MHLSGDIFDYFKAFAAGVLVSFTPCVYPVIPLTAGFIAGLNTKGTKWMGFIISLVYVFGIACTYSLLGIIAALTGRVFGQIQNHPAVFLAVGAVLLFFALVMFDVVLLPSFGANLRSKIKPRNLWTVIFFGMASGLVIGPCTAPILGTILLYVGKKQNILHAASLLFVFSYGVGASLILVGTFSGLLSRLPRSGPWLLRIKKLCGAVLLLAGLFYFIKAGKMFFNP